MIPSVSSLEKVCTAFGITLSQLFADENELLSLTPSQRKLLNNWAKLTPDQQDALFKLIDVM